MYQHFVKYYNDIFPFDESLKESLIPFIKPRGKAVDLGCGTGRLVKLVSEMGMDTSGVDLDKEMIAYAKRDFPELIFYHESMIDFIKNHQGFDLILCLGNTLPHLNYDELKKFFTYVKNALNPGGVFLIQQLNYDKILCDKPASLKKIILDNGYFERHYTYHENTIQFETILSYHGELTKDVVTLYPHTRQVLSSLLNNMQLSLTFSHDFKDLKQDLNAYYISMIIKK